MSPGELLSIDVALSFLGGDETIFFELVKVFLEDAPENMKILKHAIDERDVELIRRQTHNFISNAGSIGSERLKNAATTMNRYAKDGKLDEIRMLFSEFEREMNEAFDQLTAWAQGREHDES